MTRVVCTCVVFAIISAGTLASDETCYVTVATEAGKIRGARREAGGVAYYSFRNVSYARQPIGQLRFKELQPAEPWEGEMNATEDGPACPQQNVFYGRLMTPAAIGEACIHASIHVPVDAAIALVDARPCRSARQLRPPHPMHHRTPPHRQGRGRTKRPLPIVVFVHGGGFSFGSGDADVHGPEYLVRKGVIVVTFNYRVGALGFLSLNTSSAPGNAGLRDMVTLLRWVRRHADTFGGDAACVTLAGQSAGAAAAHLLSLSHEARGLFNRFIMMSGAATRSFYSSSPSNAARLAGIMLEKLNINASDADEVETRLINEPMERVQAVDSKLQDLGGIVAFTPIVESHHPGVPPMITEDPDLLVDRGVGSATPRIIGFTDNECQSFKHRLEEIQIVERIKENPLIVVPPGVLFQVPQEELPQIVQKVMARYFVGEPNIESFIRYCSDAYFVYPALNAAQKGGDSAYLYRFSYVGGATEIMQNATGSTCAGGCRGAAHVEDLLYVFKANSYPHYPYSPRDVAMQDWMTTLFTNFVKTGNPTSTLGRHSQWTPVSGDRITYLDIRNPQEYRMSDLDTQLLETKYFFDSLYRITQKTD